MTRQCCAGCRRLMTIVSAGLCSACYEAHRAAGTLDAYARAADLPTIPAADLSWRGDALCAEVDAELFFPEKGESMREAKSICRECLVRAECLDYALETRQRYGIYGGTSERQRRALLDLDDDDAEEVSVA